MNKFEKKNTESVNNIYSEYLLMDPHTFDQDKEKGRRKLESGGIEEYIKSNYEVKNTTSEAITLMEYYVHNYDWDNAGSHKHYKQLIKWHIGQAYAISGNYDNALIYFKELQKEGYTGVGKEYVEATIAFLEKDKNTLQEIITGINIDIAYNGKFIKQFETFFNNSYLEAYSGMSVAQMKDFLTTKK